MQYAKAIAILNQKTNIKSNSVIKLGIRDIIYTQKIYSTQYSLKNSAHIF